ncbi:MAG: VWA domain-containing protein [Alistipes sp.]|nr:VWA domain-containing protein [Alistipes sp.]
MYTQSITRNHRTAFVLLIDASGSMSEETTYGGRRMTKAAAVTSITNSLLFELIERARRDDDVRNYYDIAVLGYSGDDEVRSLLPDERESLTISELAACKATMRTEVLPCRLPNGGISLRELPSPQWIATNAAGPTPMCEALRRARDFVAAWCAEPAHAESFPPVVFNITDGEATDCEDDELLAVSEQIKSLHTADGNVLLINIHISNCDDPRAVFFPSAAEADYPNRYASLLYECSSEMPRVFDEAIRESKGPEAMPPFRGMSFNASAAELLAMLNIGSISIKTE